MNRLLGAVAVALAASAVTFLIFYVMPNGDPAVRMAGRNADAQQIEAIRKDWGMDRSLPVQYATMMGKIVEGDVLSYITQTNVMEEIRQRAPRTIALALIAMTMAVLVSIGAATLVSTGGRQRWDRLLRPLSLIAISVPAFWLAVVLSDLPGFRWGLLPSGGYVPLTENPAAWAEHLVLPGIALGLAAAGLYYHLLRSRLEEEGHREHVSAARARGLGERRVFWRHTMPGAIVPVLPLLALDLGVMIAGGAVLVESAFDIQGIGQYAASAVTDLDVPVVMVITIFGSLTIVAINAVADIAVGLLDPRADPRRKAGHRGPHG